MEQLKRAAELILEVMSEMDTSSKVCPQCDRRKYTKWAEAQLHKELESVYKKLVRWSDDGRTGASCESRTHISSIPRKDSGH